MGTFEGYICRGCGFVEWYARSASEIPIGAEYASELFEIEAESVYRER